MTADAATSGAPLLEVTDLSVAFTGHEDTVTVVEHVSFSVQAGETLGIVGEIGFGQDASRRSAPSACCRAAEVLTGSRPLRGSRPDAHADSRAPGDARRRRLGVFQNPMTSLNPVTSIGAQIVEALRTHDPLGRRAAAKRCIELLAAVGIRRARAPGGPVPA